MMTLKQQRRDEGHHHEVKGQGHTGELLPPPGWLDCPPRGQEILGSLIPSKVPLADESFNTDTIQRYSIKQVIQVLGQKLGLVIDLTHSSRYYNPNEWRKHGIKHVKIACKGRDSVPENEAVNQFVYEVSQFQLEHQQRKYILVHCTHGHNRTGYMIVHYLMRTLPSISITQAIEMFADARPPGIYKPGYIDSLFNFYHEKKPPDTAVCPPTPEWKLRSESDLHGDHAIPDDDDDGGDDLSCETHELVIITNDDILGDQIPSRQEMAMRQFCNQTLKLQRRTRQFPGSHPVSVNWDNLQLLRQRYYYTTWKADGTRYMMLITMDGCYLIDRHFSFRRVQMRFPCLHHHHHHHHHFTLLDGEMVIDTIPDTQKQTLLDGGVVLDTIPDTQKQTSLDDEVVLDTIPDTQKQERRYLVYDMMAINQVSIVELPFYERWKLIEKEVIEPRNFERGHMDQCQNPHYSYEMEPFRVRRKDFWPLPCVTKILKKLIPKQLSHAADGLIFQGRNDPYVPRTHEGLLKWKYPEMNSVDFLFEVVNNHQSLYLFEQGKKKPMGNGTVVFPGGHDASAYTGKIIECSWNSERGSWMCMRVRTDKGSPNEFSTYNKVMRSIKDNIMEDILLKEIDEIIQLPLYANV